MVFQRGLTGSPARGNLYGAKVVGRFVCGGPDEVEDETAVHQLNTVIQQTMLWTTEKPCQLINSHCCSLLLCLRLHRSIRGK